jgi:nucleoside-diphosphate-sugar epimerase
MQKLFGEFLVRGAFNEFGLRYLIVRPFNAVGSGELPAIRGKGEVEFGMAHVIPDFVYKALIKQTPFEIFGDGEQVRTFTHAKDIATAVRMMIEKKVENDDFNICGNNTYKMKELAEIIWAKVNPSTSLPDFKYLPSLKGDVKFRIGISEKAKRILGWSPKYDINYIIDDVLDFIKRHMEQIG